MSDMPARAKSEPGDAAPRIDADQRGGPGQHRSAWAGDNLPDTPPGASWGATPPGSIYDYIRVAAFSLDPDGRVSQWSERAADFFNTPASAVLGKDIIQAFVPRRLWQRGYERLEKILDGQEWVGLVPYRDVTGTDGLAEIYVIPADTAEGPGAECVAVDVQAIRSIETDLAASQAVFGQSPMGFFLFDNNARLLRVNEGFAATFGRPSEDHRGLTAHDLLPRVEADRLNAALRQVLDTGSPVLDMQLVGVFPATPGRRRWAVSLYRLHSGSGRPIGVAGVAVDVTGRQRAEHEAASVRRNLALLNEAGARIGSSLDLEKTARELLSVTVPHFCDMASVDLYQSLLSGDETPTGTADGCGDLRRVAFASSVSDAPELAQYVAGQGTVPVGVVHRFPFASACARALRTPQTVVLDGDSADYTGYQRGLGGILQCTLAVPLVSRDAVLGLVQFTRAKGSEPFGERDTALAEELAARVAVSLDNARLYHREHQRALVLQRSLLPPSNPEAAGLDIACRYLPGSTATEVGGDWFDVIDLPGHRTALVVGDVMGRGLRAAVVMGELRTALRTLAKLDLEPADALTELDQIAQGLGDTLSGRNLRAAGDDPSDLSEIYLATCVYAVYDAVTRRCTFANAGHLPPVVVYPGERPLMLEGLPAGMPLGVGGGVGGEPFEEVDVDLPDGTLLGLYTDGLVESKRHTLDEGLEAFRRALDHRASSLEDLCDNVLTAMNPHHGQDDTALLMARVRALPPGAVGDWILPPQPTSVGRSRELACAKLDQWGLGELVEVAELLVSELVTNALRHGEGDIRLRLLLDRTLVCEVWDSGLVQPRRRRARDTDEGGRGLLLVSMLARSWGSRRTPRGKTVWFELPLPGAGPAGPNLTEVLLSAF